MTQPTAQFSTAEEAAGFLQSNPGPILVLAPEVLEQIQQAEQSGGFEGGMSGASGEGGFSASGDSGPNASSGTEQPPLDFDIEGAWTSDGIARVAEGVATFASGVAEAAHWVAERGIVPVVVVPMEELKKLVGLGTPDGA